ncbi:MAG: peptidyl-prolyl cis-trans isomerase [Phycisphaerae bacterium]|nr:peptidyl-prolyl cis-trans isomerase [Phycisphaerae bacterium]
MTRTTLALALSATLGLLCGTTLAQTKETPKAEPARAPAADTKSTPEAAKVVLVKMSTTEGDIVIELNETAAPITVKNFLAYVDKGFYSGTIFHRVIPTFMIQGGGFTADWKQKPTDPPIKNEWRNGLKNKRGTIAMARTNVADSATSQFFINVKDNDMLDQARDGAAYCVFGRVVSGMDVVDKIKDGETTRQPVNGENSKPVKPVEIKGVARVSDKDATKPTPAPTPAPKHDEPKKDDAKKDDKKGK